MYIVDIYIETPEKSLDSTTQEVQNATVIVNNLWKVRIVFPPCLDFIDNLQNLDNCSPFAFPSKRMNRQNVTLSCLGNKHFYDSLFLILFGIYFTQIHKLIMQIIYVFILSTYLSN
jgi:hypothetical protein